jgi:hypothetical protein
MIMAAIMPNGPSQEPAAARPAAWPIRRVSWRAAGLSKSR